MKARKISALLEQISECETVIERINESIDWESMLDFVQTRCPHWPTQVQLEETMENIEFGAAQIEDLQLERLNLITLLKVLNETE